MADPDLDAIRARADAATDGPWWPRYGGEPGYIYASASLTLIAEVTGEASDAAPRPNSTFIANARTDIPALLNALDEARAELDANWPELVRAERRQRARAEKAEAQVAAVRALCDERDNPNWGKHAGLMMTKWVRAVLDGAVPPPAAGCRTEEVDGDPVLVHGADDWDDIDRAAFADVIRAVKAKHESTHRLPAASADVHKPFTDDGVAYCGWDKHEGCGEVWPCATERAKALFLAAALGEPAAPTHAFEMPPAHWCVAPGQEPCGHLLDPDDQFSHCRGFAGDPIHTPTAPTHEFVPFGREVSAPVDCCASKATGPVCFRHASDPIHGGGAA